jgi:hypothetical protein
VPGTIVALVVATGGGRAQAAGGDHRQPLRRHPAALPAFALPEFSWETVRSC